MAEFTPGPWVADVVGDDEPAFRVTGFFRGDVRDSDDNVIAYLPEFGHEETNAVLRVDAALIAASPEMYEALKELVGAFCADDCDHSGCDYRAADRAIRKAEGRPDPAPTRNQEVAAGRRWADLQSDTEALDGDQVL